MKTSICILLATLALGAEMASANVETNHTCPFQQQGTLEAPQVVLARADVVVPRIKMASATGDTSNGATGARQ